MTEAEIIERIEEEIETLWTEIPEDRDGYDPTFDPTLDPIFDKIHELEDLLRLPPERIVALAPRYIYIPPDDRQLPLIGPGL